MSFIGIAFVVLVVSPIGVLGCNGPSDVAQRQTASPKDESLEGHARMLTLLARIRDDADRENEYVGAGALRKVEAS